MMKTIYIDWEEREVLTEKEFEEEVAEERKRLVDDDETFEYWLECNYTMLDLWKMNLNERVQILAKYREHCEREARENLLYEHSGYFEKFEVEV